METKIQNANQATFSTIEEVASYLKHKCRVRDDACGVSFEPLPGAPDCRYQVQQFFAKNFAQYGVTAGGGCGRFIKMSDCSFEKLNAHLDEASRIQVNAMQRVNASLKNEGRRP